MPYKKLKLPASRLAVASLLGLSSLFIAFFSTYPDRVKAAEGTLALANTRSSPGDLEIGGELAGLPLGTTRYVRYQDLLSLPEETYTISDDSNFKGKMQISGVALTTLAKLVGEKDRSDLIVAICDDKYRSNYPSDYLAAHHPILVLKINGKTRESWPKSSGENADMGPYVISHPPFTPSFKVLSHNDEAQIPFGVVRIEFQSEARVLGVIKPHARFRDNEQVQQGYRIASQDCYRCHQMGAEGGEKAQRSWLILSAWAATDQKNFEAYIRNPKSVMKGSQMPGQAGYDDATLHALTAYFATFTDTGKH